MTFTVLRIALVGLPGSGKSTLGRQLAKRLHLGFVDSDQVIEQELGCAIKAYFERAGEEAFRAIEERVIDTLTQGQSAVIATGGGAVLSPLNRQHLIERSRVVYLHAQPELIAQRLQGDHQRPLLQVADPLARLHELYQVRDPLYRSMSNCIIETGRPAMSRLIEMIVTQLQLTGAER